MGAIETLVTSLEDTFPIIKKRQRNKTITLAVICFIYFLIGLVLCIESGNYWVEIFTEYAADWTLYMVGIFECISIAWFYGKFPFFGLVNLCLDF